MEQMLQAMLDDGLSEDDLDEMFDDFVYAFEAALGAELDPTPTPTPTAMPTPTPVPPRGFARARPMGSVRCPPQRKWMCAFSRSFGENKPGF